MGYETSYTKRPWWVRNVFFGYETSRKNGYETTGTKRLGYETTRTPVLDVKLGDYFL